MKRIGLLFLFVSVVLAAQPAPAETCPVMICVYSEVPDQTGGGGSPQTSITITPKDIENAVNATSEGVGVVQKFLGGLAALIPRSEGRQPGPPPPPPSPPRPTSYRNASESHSRAPKNVDERNKFKRDILDGPSGSFQNLRSNPYQGNYPIYGEARSGSDPYRPGANKLLPPGTAATAADPVNLATGALQLDQTDLSFPGPVRPLEFRRLYDSSSNQRSGLGSNWTHNYDVWLRPITEFNAPAAYPPHLPYSQGILLHDGNTAVDTIYFRIAADLYFPIAGPADSLRKEWDGWLLKRADGSWRRFNTDGYLIEDRDRFSNGYRIDYEPTPLYSVYRYHCPSLGMSIEKPCVMLGYVFGERYARRFYYETTYAWGADRMYGEWLPSGRSSVINFVLADRDREGADDDLSTHLLASFGEDFFETYYEGIFDDPIRGRINEPIARKIIPATVEFLTSIIQTKNLFEGRKLTKEVLGRASRPLFDALRNDGIFTDDTGKVAQNLSSSNYSRVYNFNLALVAEVLYPSIVNTGHEYENHPAVAAATDLPANEDVPLPPTAFADVGTRVSRQTWFNTAYRILGHFIRHNGQSPVLRTRYAVDGGHTHRPTRVTDDLGRTLTFDYYEYKLGSAREAGLLQRVTGPSNASVEYTFHRPTWYPHFLNEMFLIRVERDDQTNQLPGLQASPKFTLNFQYFWDSPGSEAKIFDWAWGVWRILESSDAQAAPWAAGHYISTVADNIVRVSRQNRSVNPWTQVVESETAYVYPALHPSFDRVAAQRYGADAVASLSSKAILDGHTLLHWTTQLPEVTFRWPQSIQSSRLNGFLPAAIRERYRMEPLPLAWQGPSPPQVPTPYFPAASPQSGLPSLVRARTSCGNILHAATIYAGLSVTFSTRRGNYEMSPFVDSQDSFGQENFFETRARARRDANRICTWVSITDRDGKLSFAGMNYAGKKLVSAVPLNAAHSQFAYFENWHNEDGLTVESRGSNGFPGAVNTHVVYPLTVDFDEARWLQRAAPHTVVELPNGGKVANWSVAGSPDVTARLMSIEYEPYYQQVARIRTGYLSEAGTYHLQRLTTYSFCSSDNPENTNLSYTGPTPREDIASFLASAEISSGVLPISNPCRKTAPIRMETGPPSAFRQAATLSFNESGRLKKFEDSHGRLTKYEYFLSGRFSDNQPSAEVSSSRSPDGRGFLARIVYERSDSFTFADGIEGCALLGLYKGMLPPSCQNPSLELRAIGLPQAAVDAIIAASNAPAKHVEQFDWYQTGHTKLHRVANRTVNFRRDLDGRVLELSGPANFRTTFTYNDAGRPAESRSHNPLGATIGLTSRVWDTEGRLKSVRISQSQTSRPETSYTYSLEGRLVRTRNPSGRIDELYYDPLGRVTESRSFAEATPKSMRVQRYFYTSRGELDSISFGTDAQRTQLGVMDQKFHWDGFGRLIAMHDEHGRRFSYKYDEADRLTKAAQIDVPSSKSERSSQPLALTIFEYDADGRLVIREDDGVTTARVSYDAIGRVSSASTAIAGPTRFAYDPQGRLIWMKDAGNNQSATVFDANGSISFSTSIRAGRALRFALTTRNSYTDGGFLAERIHYGANGEERIERWEPDEYGFVKRYTSPAGVVQEYDRNFAGLPYMTVAPRRVDQVRPDEAIAHIEPDRMGRTALITDSRQNETRIEYDAFGQVSKIWDPGQPNATKFYFDSYGRHIRTRLSDGRTLRNRFNSNHYLRSQWLETPSGTKTLLTNYSYDARGRVTRALEHNPELTAIGMPAVAVTNEYEYDSAGRLKTDKSSIAQVHLPVRFDFRMNSRGIYAERHLVYPSGTVWTESFDSIGRLQSMSRAGSGPPSSVSFNWIGDLYAGRTQTWRENADPLIETATFDGFASRRLWEYRVVRSNTSGPQNSQWETDYLAGAPDEFLALPLAHWEVVRDAESRVGHVLSYFGHPATLVNGVREALPTGPHAALWEGFTSDAARRTDRYFRKFPLNLNNTIFAPPPNYTDDSLVDQAAASTNASGQQFSYDAFLGLAAILDITSNTYTWSTPPRVPGSRLSSVSNAQVRYDQLGNVRKIGALSLRFDARGRLVASRQGTGPWQEGYAYDVLGRLVAIVSTDRVILRFVYDGGKMISAYDANGNRWEAAWGPLDGQLLDWRVSSGAPFIPLLDPRRSIAAVWNGQERVLMDTSQYEPYGGVFRLRHESADAVACNEQLSSAICPSLTGLPFGFGSAFRSTVTGLYLLGARWYSPVLGEFLTPDPIRAGDSLNPYAYAANDPVNRWDPSGYSSRSFVEGAKDALNATAGAASRLLHRVMYAQPRWEFGPLGQIIGILAYSPPDTALSRNPDPSTLANMNPALRLAASAYAADEALTNGDPFFAGQHTMDAAFEGINLGMLAQGGGDLLRAASLPVLNFWRAGMLSMRLGTAALPPVMEAGLPAGRAVVTAPVSIASSGEAAIAPAVSNTAVTAAAPATETLVGTSTSMMRAQAAAHIANTPNHQLRFLLDSSGRFLSSQGLTHAELIDNPAIVQMGHMTSRKSGLPERIMLQGAWENQLNAITIERPGLSSYAQSIAIDIGEIAVDRRTAIFWEEIGWLRPGTVANAPVILP
jgi:RHS repeat-associated protein